MCIADRKKNNLVSYLKNSSKKLRKYESVVLFRRRARSGRLRRLKQSALCNLFSENRLTDRFFIPELLI